MVSPLCLVMEARKMVRSRYSLVADEDVKKKKKNKKKTNMAHTSLAQWFMSAYAHLLPWKIITRTSATYQFVVSRALLG